MNIILIIIDTLRYDYIGAHGNQWIHTPNMDRLAGRSWVFDMSFTGSYPTIPHRTDVMKGTCGAPFHPWKPLRHDAVTLPEALGAAGYCTQLIHDTPHLVNGGHNFDWPFHAWTFVRGAEVDRPWIDAATQWPANWARDPLFDFVDDEALKTGLIATYSRANRKRLKDEDWNAAKLFLTASQWLRDNAGRDNFFLWVDCFDPHEPWDAPPEMMAIYDHTPGYDGSIDPRSFVGRNDKRMSDAARRRVAAQYAAGVSWVDRWLGRFMDTLEETGLANNTAILLTADHGTNVGERNGFGKGPVREREAHTPFMVSVPGGDTGRSSMIVQPQDIFATVAGLAGLDVPEGLQSHDVLAAARAGRHGPRRVALAGGPADSWRGEAAKTLFSVFADEWWMEYAARPECCRLSRYGSVQDEAAGNAPVVERLRADALEEIQRRGIAPELLEWLRANGEAQWPADCRFWDGWPGPSGYTPYFNRLYAGA